MDQVKRSRPAPSWPATVSADAEDEVWLAKARDFATPGEPGFVQALDSLPPGPLLVAVLENSANDLSRHSRPELGAVLRACERVITYARCVQFLVVREMERRGLAALVGGFGPAAAGAGGDGEGDGEGGCGGHLGGDQDGERL